MNTTMERELSAKHEAFAQRIANGDAASRAYAAVYGKKGATAEVNGSRLLRNAKVKARVCELQKENERRSRMSRDEALAYLAAVVRTPCGQVTPRSNLAEVCCEKQTRDGVVRVVKMPSKLAAIQLTARMCAWNQSGGNNDSVPGLDELLSRIIKPGIPRACSLNSAVYR